MKMVRAFGDAVVHGPGRTIRGISTGSSKKWNGFRSGLHTLLHWRTPTTRPAVPDPTDPEVLSQLHSTRWSSDLSHDVEATRTARLLKIQSYAWIPHLFLIPGLTVVWIIYHPTGQWTYDALTFSSLWRFVWVLSLPNCLFAWVGFITPDMVYSKEVMDKKPVHREYIRNFFIVLVTKGSNEAAVRRGYNKLIKLEKYHPSVKVVVLTDEPYVYPDLQNIVCPKSYKSPLGESALRDVRALDKRELIFFQHHLQARPSTRLAPSTTSVTTSRSVSTTGSCTCAFEKGSATERSFEAMTGADLLLHSLSTLPRLPPTALLTNRDEESTTDGESLRHCIEFIRYTPHHFGQGIILYNGEGFWENWYFTVADGIRVGDDLARFHFQNSVIHRPVFGVHGSFLMTNGEMENECTWFVSLSLARLQNADPLRLAGISDRSPKVRSAFCSRLHLDGALLDTTNNLLTRL